MNANIIPFEGAQLPARRAKLGVSQDVMTGADYPQLSIRGRVFSYVRDGIREALVDKASGTAVGQLSLVIVRANAQARQYFIGMFDSKQEGVQPACFSLNGIKPDVNAKQPQHSTCAGCPHAVFGTALGGKGQACKPHARLAVAPASDLGKLMLLRVPITSLQRDKVNGTGLRDLIAKAKSRGLEYNELLVRVGFDANVTGTKLTFTPAGILDDATYEAACKLYDDPLVKEIVGVVDGGVMQAQVTAAVAAPAVPDALPPPPSAAAVTVAATGVLAGVDDLLAGSATAAAVAPAKSATSKGQGKKPQAAAVDEDDAKLDALATASPADTQQELLDDMNSLLGDFDD